MEQPSGQQPALLPDQLSDGGRRRRRHRGVSGLEAVGLRDEGQHGSDIPKRTAALTVCWVGVGLLRTCFLIPGWQIWELPFVSHGLPELKEPGSFRGAWQKAAVGAGRHWLL